MLSRNTSTSQALSLEWVSFHSFSRPLLVQEGCWISSGKKGNSYGQVERGAGLLVYVMNN